ncbi:SRPBCC domain-containing protein [Saccharomonospora sp. NPDC006951]
MPNTENLTASMSVNQPPQDVFAAITNVRGWWSENLIGDTAALHDEFVFIDDYTHAGEVAQGKPGIRFARFQITEIEPGKRVVWRVVDACLTFVEDSGEWTGTDVIFDLATTEDGTNLYFTHKGLTTASECFDSCSQGWTFYITTSLPELITTGTGQPMPSYRR